MSSEEPADPWGARPKPERPAPLPSMTVPAAPAAPATDAPAAAPADPASAERVRFVGALWEWQKIVLKGMLLYIPTVGFYRFWLRTDLRRFGWRSVVVRDEVLEYRGTARELLMGFLIAIAIYLPITVAYTLLGIYAETVQAFASIPFFLFLVLFGYYAAYRARRYRLTRTVYRGVRFWMGGSAWRFAFLALLSLIATIVTLGLAWPWMQAKLETYRMRNSHYGNLQGDFHGTGWGLFKALFWPALATLILALIPFVNVLAAPAILSAFTVVLARWRLGGASFGPVRLGNDAGVLSLVGPAYLTALVAIAFFVVWMGAGLAGMLALHGTRIWSTSFWELMFTFALAVWDIIYTLVFLAAWAVIGLVVLNFIKMAFYDFHAIKRLAEHTMLTNVDALDGVVAKGQAEGSFGEGLADALGSDGF